MEDGTITFYEKMFWNNIDTDCEIYTYEYFQQKDVCRLCWRKNANTYLFQENSEIEPQKTLVNVVQECLNIELHNKNPRNICESCYNEIKRFDCFKNFCKHNNKKLTEIFVKEQENNKIDQNKIKEEEFEINFDNLDIDNVEPIDKIEVEVKMPITHSKFRRKQTLKKSDRYCKKCRLELSSENELASHNSEYHGYENNGTSFKCFGCEKRFNTKKLRNRHETNFCKQLNEGFKCTICDRFLPKRNIFEYHMRDHIHNTKTELPECIFKCSKCVQTFPCNKLLKEHKSQHNKKKNYVCDTCGRIFSRQDYLYKHKLSHSGIKRYQCQHCDFKAVQRSSLTVHMRKHTGDRPYSCDVCPQQCVSSSSLRAHMRRHLGLKKYECAVCNKKFGYKISLEEHISSAHVRSESHPCELCGATYTRLRGLKRHLAAKHGNDNTKMNQNVLIQFS